MNNLIIMLIILAVVVLVFEAVSYSVYGPISCRCWPKVRPLLDDAWFNSLDNRILSLPVGYISTDPAPLFSKYHYSGPVNFRIPRWSAAHREIEERFASFISEKEST